MASELRVDTLKDSSGNNSVGMAYVSGGSAKAWIYCANQATSIINSFNISSLDDDGTADAGANLSSAMDSADYVTTIGSQTFNNSGNAGASVRNASITSKSASTVELSGGYTNSGGLWVAYEGAAYFNLIVQGDLA